MWSSMVNGAIFMTKVANVLNIPIIATEQKPFKSTISEFNNINITHTFSKTLFSMMTIEMSELLQSDTFRNCHDIYLFGIETHVCIMQTTLDLLRLGYHVHLIVDAITSMNQIDRDGALERFRALSATTFNNGAVLTLTTAESALFELMSDASRPEFKKVVPLIKEYALAKNTNTHFPTNSKL